MLLDIIPQNKWNILSKFIAAFSIPTIGSPIQFAFKNFYMKEYKMLEMDESFKEKFLTFCYPADLHNREQEIEFDKVYWGADSTFVIFDRKKENKIVGCVQLISKSDSIRIPCEYSRLNNNQSFDPLNMYNTDKIGEIYRCRRSFDLKLKDSLIVVSMLFKALQAKVNQTNTAYLYITFDSTNRELRNLYTRKMFFQNPEIVVHYGDDPKDWQLLHKDCQLHENKFATIDRSHFYLQTWFRQNLKKKKLTLQPVKTKVPHTITENRKFIFANVRPKWRYINTIGINALQTK